MYLPSFFGHAHHASPYLGTFTKIVALGTITGALFFTFSCQKNINIAHFKNMFL
jgi:hypothetical protein